MKYDEINLGDNVSFEVTITQDMVDKFVEISGDNSDIHIDREFAIKLGHKDIVVHGVLLASFISRVSGCLLPGRLSVLQGMELKFTNPVFIGDRLLVSSKVVEKLDTFKRVKVKAMIYKLSDNIDEAKTICVKASFIAGLSA